MVISIVSSISVRNSISTELILLRPGVDGSRLIKYHTPVYHTVKSRHLGTAVWDDPSHKKKKPIGSFVRFDLAVMKRSVADVSRQEKNML